MSVAVSVQLHAQSFVPGSRASATITLHAEHANLTTSASSASRPTSRHGFSQSASAAAAFGSAQDAAAVADYVVCEFSGRWSTDRKWVVPHAHKLEDPSKWMDFHAHSPIASGSTPKITQRVPDPTVGPYPWSAALADANAIGGGAREGYVGSIFRSQPLVVCEREQIPVGSQVSFDVDCVLPEKLPPTFRGSAVRYNYALTVVVKSSDLSAPRVMRAPLRVVPAGGTGSDEQRAAEVIPVPTPRDVGPIANRFLQDKNCVVLSMSARLLKRAPPDDIEIALALSLNGRLTPYLPMSAQSLSGSGNGDLGTLEELAFMSNVKVRDHGSVDGAGGEDGYLKRYVIPVYSITKGSEAIARLHLSKGVHQVGGTVSITFNFVGEIRCYRVDACLEAQETVNEELVVGRPARADGTRPSRTVFRKVFGEQGEFVESCQNTNMTFSLPLDSPPSFTTEVVAVRWLLSFVFLTPQSAEKAKDGSDLNEKGGILDNVSNDGNLGGAEEVEVEVQGPGLPTEGTMLRGNGKGIQCDALRWSLPITVTGQTGTPIGTRGSSRQ